MRGPTGLFTVGTLIASLTACSHPLQVKNLDLYAAPLRLSSFERPPNVAVLPYQGQPDGLSYFNIIVQRINESPLVSQVQTEYIPNRSGSAGFQPDLILSISTTANYRSSLWNFPINWPGFLIGTPAWNGYVYYADIMTRIVIHDSQREVLSQSDIPVSYSIRQAEMDRTIFTSFPIGWFSFGALSFLGGFYNAAVFDRDIIGALQVHLKDNYGTYIANQIQPKVQAAADSIRVLEPVAAPPVAAPPDMQQPEVTPPNAEP